MTGRFEGSQRKEILSAAACWELLESHRLGRLATAADGRPDIIPVNYRAQDHTVYFKSAEGSKLAALTVNPQVAFEVDGMSENAAWSVVVHGTATVVQSFGEMAILDELGIEPWEEGTKFNYIAITADQVTGRRLSRVEAV